MSERVALIFPVVISAVTGRRVRGATATFILERTETGTPSFETAVGTTCRLACPQQGAMA